jgi:hypothetical protein
VTKGLRAGFNGPRSHILDRLTFGAWRDRITKRCIMAGARLSPNLVQRPIEWGII